MRHTLLTLGFLLSFASLSSAQQTPLLFQRPALSQDRIAFSFAGDLWIVPREGGEAARLTTGIGYESGPAFSPDGTEIAFTGEYDGNTDVYVISAKGGVPRRVTYHPGPDTAVGWTPDGQRILFYSLRNGSRLMRLYTIPAAGGFETEVPLPTGRGGSFSPDGSRLAYLPLWPAFLQWKNYRGGTASKIWLANLSDSSVVEIPRQNANDFNPMWVGDQVYFLSDRNGRFTLFGYDTRTRKVSQLIKNDGLDIKSAAAGPGAIVYEQFGEINLYDLKTGRTSPVKITLNGDLPGVRPRYEKVAGRISNFALSPTGARALFEARGEILSVPAEKGNPRNLTHSPGVADRDPAWSPDGKWIAYFSDESGEYGLHLSEQSGIGRVRKFPLGNPPSYFYTPTWSPDSKKIVYLDKRLNLWYLDLEKGTPVKVDTNLYDSPARVMDPNWSPDSRWITYTRQLKNRMCAVFVYSIETGRSQQITDGLSDARFASFDRNGKYLYFAASTDIGPATGWQDLSTLSHRSTRSVYVVVLKRGEPSPLAPESDEEKSPDEKKGEKQDEPRDEKQDKPKDEKKDESVKPTAKSEPVTVAIDFEGIGQRILALPIQAGNFVGLKTAKSGTIYLLEGLMAPTLNLQWGLTIHKFELQKRKFEKVVEWVNGFTLSANGEKMLFAQGEGAARRFTIAPTNAPLKPGEGQLKLDEMEVYVDPQAEWRQMYEEAWRIQRDFFYDPGLHGLDYEGTKQKYRPYLAGIAHREDLNYLFREMLGNMSVGHHWSSGGDQPRTTQVPGGLLGCDLQVDHDRYRFAKIYNGENWNPNLSAPLTQPGIEVRVGDYLIAVNDREVRSSENFYAFFEATAGKQVKIKVSVNPDGSGAREYTVVPVANEEGLRTLDWIEGNRRKVDQLSGGKLAYVYLSNTASGGFTDFNRYYFSQVDKEGAVLDERFNGGGLIADYIVDYLRRPLLSKFAARDGEDVSSPSGSIYGPKAMIINEFAGSGGDIMPWLFRKSGIGPLIGKRTWGGTVGVYDFPPLIDGGLVTAPRVAFYNPQQGTWDLENFGAPPDVEIDLDPAEWRKGRDPQLEKAVEVVLSELKRRPAPRYQRPPYPNYHNGDGPVSRRPETSGKTDKAGVKTTGGSGQH
ncbi:MAG TPA: PDZ domain-containing protein [Blastocatellia bacterium]|nr:PDZ domain-containing protein [Blastocatellia bacterium]